MLSLRYAQSNTRQPTRHRSSMLVRAVISALFLLFVSQALHASPAIAQECVVIGEDMEGRVIPYAQATGHGWYVPDSNLPPEEWMEANRQWINQKMNEGAQIINIGPSPNNPNYPDITSEYYRMERNEIAARGYPTTNVWPEG